VAEVRKIHREYNGKSRLAIAKTGLHSVNPGLQPGLAIVKSRLNKAQSWAHPLTYIYQETFFRNLLGQGRTYLRSARKSLTTRQNLKKLAPSSSTNSTSTKQNLKKITQINNDVTEETCSDKAEPRQNLENLATNTPTNSTSMRQNLRKISQINSDVNKENCQDNAEPKKDN